MGTVNDHIAFDSHTSGWIQGYTNPVSQQLAAVLKNVDTESIIEARVSGSAKGNFYYSIVETTGGATELTTSTRVITANNGWEAMETSTFFEATKFQDLSFSVDLSKGDLEGDMTIFNLTLMVQIV